MVVEQGMQFFSLNIDGLKYNNHTRLQQRYTNDVMQVIMHLNQVQ